MSERISAQQAQSISEISRFHELIGIAHQERLNRHGKKTYFIRNRHINPTNVCSVQCPLCAFKRKKEETGSFTLSFDEVAERAADATRMRATELHVVGAVNPELDLNYHCRLLETMKFAAPDCHIQGYTAQEIFALHLQSGTSVSDVLKILVASGLGSLPGGGAEIFAPEVRKVICPDKISADQWLMVHREAHKLGIKSNATMLYGHIESVEHRIAHLERLRELQDETGGFQAFIPLPFHPQNTNFFSLPGPGGLHDLTVLALSRVFLDNFPHIKAFWIMLGERLSQVSLATGVNDLDGTVVEEKISHSAGARTPQGLTPKHMIELIQEAGFEPIERDTLYRVILPRQEAD